MRNESSDRNDSPGGDSQPEKHTRDPLAAHDARPDKPERHAHDDQNDREAAMPPTKAGNHNEPEAHPDSRAWQEGQTSKLSGAGWGSEPAGGSVVDKRGPKKGE